MNAYMRPAKTNGEDYEHIYAFVNLFDLPLQSQLSGCEMNTSAFLSNNSKQKK